MKESLVIPNIYGLITFGAGVSQHVLLQERWKPESDPENSGRMELPGGKWRAWEPAGDCLRRELMEETGLDVTVDPSQIATVSHGNDSVDVIDPALVVQLTRGPYPSTLIVLRGNAQGTPVRQGDGSRNAAWHDLTEISRMLESTPERFTAMTFAILATAIERGLLA